MVAVAVVELGGRPERVRSPETNRHGTSIVGEVLGAQALGLARRVQRIADQDEAGSGHARRRRPSSTCARPSSVPRARPPSSVGCVRSATSASSSSRTAASSTGARSGARRPAFRYGKSMRRDRQWAPAPPRARRAWVVAVRRPAPGASSTAFDRLAPRAPSAGASRASRMRRASVSSAMRSAAPLVSAAVVGVGGRGARRGTPAAPPGGSGSSGSACSVRSSTPSAQPTGSPRQRSTVAGAAAPDRCATSRWSISPRHRRPAPDRVHHRRPRPSSTSAPRRVDGAEHVLGRRAALDVEVELAAARPRRAADGASAAARRGPSGSGGAGGAGRSAARLQLADQMVELGQHLVVEVPAEVGDDAAEQHAAEAGRRRDGEDAARRAPHAGSARSGDEVRPPARPAASASRYPLRATSERAVRRSGGACQRAMPAACSLTASSSDAASSLSPSSSLAERDRLARPIPRHTGGVEPEGHRQVARGGSAASTASMTASESVGDRAQGGRRPGTASTARPGWPARRRRTSSSSSGSGIASRIVVDPLLVVRVRRPGRPTRPLVGDVGDAERLGEADCSDADHVADLVDHLVAIAVERRRRRWPAPRRSARRPALVSCCTSSLVPCQMWGMSSPSEQGVEHRARRRRPTRSTS